MNVLKDVKKPIAIDPVIVCKVNSEREGNPENLFPENVEAIPLSFALCDSRDTEFI